MPHLPPTHHETNKCDSPTKQRIKVKQPKCPGFKFKPHQVNDSSQSNQVTNHLISHFTSKSNKCHKDCFTKLKCSQRGSHSTLTWISHKPHKDVYGRAHKGVEMSLVRWLYLQPPKVGGEAFILAPKKLTVGN
jgi:hypothetical protein